MGKIRTIAATTITSLALGAVAFAPQAFAQHYHLHRMAGVSARHPHLRAALRLLQQAKVHLQQAEHDRGGHRDKAINHLQSAIDETQAAIASRR